MENMDGGNVHKHVQSTEKRLRGVATLVHGMPQVTIMTIELAQPPPPHWTHGATLAPNVVSGALEEAAQLQVRTTIAAPNVNQAPDVMLHLQPLAAMPASMLDVGLKMQSEAPPVTARRETMDHIDVPPIAVPVCA